MTERESACLSELPESGNLAAPSTSAEAGPPLLHHEKRSIDIAASVTRVWAVAGSFADVTWVPAVEASAATNGNIPGSNRTLDFGGPVLTETLIAYDGAVHTYAYKIDDTVANLRVVPVRGLIAQISVAPTTAGSSVVTWEATFSRVDQSSNPATGLDDAIAKRQVSDTFAAGLGGLKAKAEAER